MHKEIDQPNPRDYRRLKARQSWLEAAQSGYKSKAGASASQHKADALAKAGTDRILVLLVEFAGTDTFTWTPGQSQWDPLGVSDSSESAGVAGNCSRIITEARTFTYTGPLHNEIARPLSESDRSGSTIWVEDFGAQYYRDIITGDGIAFDYVRQDGSRVSVDYRGESVRSYFTDMSANRYAINADVYGWLQVPHSVWWYGADLCPGSRSGMRVNHSGGMPDAGSAASLVKDALDLLKAQHPDPAFWAQYDGDGDGVIDRLWIIHAGMGEEDNTTLLNRTTYGEGGMWSHAGGLVPTYPIVSGIAAGPYIMMPENAGIAVLAHEYGHNLGMGDLYSYGGGATSAGFWTLMADDWTGYPIGFLPPALDPLHLDNLGWLDPYTITDPTKAHTVTIGQASNFPGTVGVYRGVKIPLADKAAPLPVQPEGHFEWWGGKRNLALATMTLKSPIAVPATGATLEFRTAFDIELGWDFLWIQVSRDGGSQWTTLANNHTACTHATGWIGVLDGFPEDLCTAGIGGFTGRSEGYPAYSTEAFNLNAFAGADILIRFRYMTDWGTLGAGPFLGRIAVSSGGNPVFSDEPSAAASRWTLGGGFEVNPGYQTYTHNFYFQWRNVNDPKSFDRALGDPRWRSGPANTGLLVWYNDNRYSDNEITKYLADGPGFGPKGLMLVVDANPEPYRDPYYVAMGYDNEGGNVSHSSLMRDAPFSLVDSVGFTMTAGNGVYEQTQFAGRPAVSYFSDAVGYYPGAQYVSRGPGYTPPSYQWLTTQWDASVVMPSTRFFGLRAQGYGGRDPLRYNCGTMTGGVLGCQWFSEGLGYAGSDGNPGTVGGQYGWHAQILSQTEETATITIWNSAYLQSTSVPRIVGLSEALATTMIGRVGLGVGSISRQRSNTVPSGGVITQFPSAGLIVPAGTKVNLLVSSGQKPNSLPTLSPFGLALAALLCGLIAVTQRRRNPKA